MNKESRENNKASTPRLVIGVIIGYALVLYSLITGTFPSKKGAINAETLPEVYWLTVTGFFVIASYALWKVISRYKKQSI